MALRCPPNAAPKEQAEANIKKSTATRPCDAQSGAAPKGKRTSSKRVGADAAPWPNSEGSLEGGKVTNGMAKAVKLLAATALATAGFALAVFGDAWAPLAFELLPDSQLGAWLELVVPLLPMLFIGGGAVLLAFGRS